MQTTKHCTKCGNQSYIFQKSSGRHLCKKCFISYFERKFQKTLSKYLRFSSNDIVCVGLSGGKDSIALLYNLYLHFKHTKSPQLIAVTVDEGISNTFSMNQQRIELFFKQTGIDIPLIQAKYKDIFGSNMDEIVRAIKENQIKMNACTVCASIRRRIINEIALQNDANIIAIGHNLDDAAQSFMMNILRGDLSKIQKTTPYSSSTENISPFLPRIKPLFQFSEEEIIRYCDAIPLPYFSKTCQYALDFPILRKKVQTFLNELDTRSFEYKYNIVRDHLSLSKMSSHEISNSTSKNRCSICDYPTGINRSICTYCEFKQLFEKI